MPFNKYYQDELTFLDELGKEFARKNPKLAPFLESRGSDPDVERLLEGFAFLTGRLRQKLDDELPELTHSMMALLWPHYLRPIPAMSIVQFTPVTNTITEKFTVKRGCRLESRPVNGTSCPFRSCYDVDLLPLTLTALHQSRESGGSRVELALEVDSAADLGRVEMDRLRLFLHGQTYVTHAIYLYLFRHLRGLRLRVIWDGGEETIALDPKRSVHAVGMGEEGALLPYPENVFSGYRLLQEYFSLTEKFLFVDVTGLEAVSRLPGVRRFELLFDFSRPFDDQIRLKREHFRLFCTPVVNLFEMDAVPVRMDNRRVEYLIRPEGSPFEHYQPYSVNSVVGVEQVSGKVKKYHAFESFDHIIEESRKRSRPYYRVRSKPSVIDDQGVDLFISFINAEGRSDAQLFPDQETVSMRMTCCNGPLATELKERDIQVATGDSPEFATFENITMVAAYLPPPMESGLHWQLISNMALNYISLTNKDALQTILSAYNFNAFFNEQAAREHYQRLTGIVATEARPADRLYRGAPIRGTKTKLVLRESNFAGEGDLYLFSAVLNEFMALYASINSFHQLTVVGEERGAIYEWPIRIGKLHLI